MIIVRLEETLFFYLISKRIKSKASKLFKPIKYFKKHQNLIVVVIMKEFGLLKIDPSPKAEN